MTKIDKRRVVELVRQRFGDTTPADGSYADGYAACAEMILALLEKGALPTLGDEAARREADGGIPADHLKHSLDTMPEAAKAFVSMASDLPDTPRLTSADEALLFKGVEEALTGPTPPEGDAIFLDGHRYVYQPDAPPPPAPGDRSLTDDDLRHMRKAGYYRWAEGHEALRAELAVSKARDALHDTAIEAMTKVQRGLRARAEAAEAERAANAKCAIEALAKAQAAEADAKRLREALEKMLDAFLDIEGKHGAREQQATEFARAAVLKGPQL